MFSERTQVLLSPEQLARLKRIAEREGDPSGRSSGGGRRLRRGRARPRQRALERLLAMNAPVDDWEVMKAQILKSQLGDW